LIRSHGSRAALSSVALPPQADRLFDSKSPAAGIGDGRLFPKLEDLSEVLGSVVADQHLHQYRSHRLRLWDGGPPLLDADAGIPEGKDAWLVYFSPASASGAGGRAPPVGSAVRERLPRALSDRRLLRV
jgi:hypothetical protein